MLRNEIHRSSPTACILWLADLTTASRSSSAIRLDNHADPWARDAEVDFVARWKRGDAMKRWIVIVLAALAAYAAAQQPAELVIRNGLVVTAVGRTDADVRIRNGTIAEIGRNLTAAAGARVIDAKDMLVPPGAPIRTLPRRPRHYVQGRRR